MIRITDDIAISEDEIEERFIRAPGPGGQNVDKVETAVQIRFDAAASPSLDEAVVGRLAAVAGRRMTRAGIVVLTARRFRSRERNRRDAIDRLVALIRRAAIAPKRRKPTKPSRGAKQKRLDDKKKRGALKKTRGGAGDFE